MSDTPSIKSKQKQNTLEKKQHQMEKLRRNLGRHLPNFNINIFIMEFVYQIVHRVKIQAVLHNKKSKITKSKSK